KIFQRGAAFFIFLFFIHSIAFSQDNASELFGGSISSVAVLADGSVAAAVNTESAGRLIILSPKDCVSSRRFAFDEPVPKILTDMGDIGAIWGITQGSLKKWSILDGKELAAIEAAPGEILRGFLKSEDRFLVWSDKTLVLLANSGDNLNIIWSIGSKNISSVLTDPLNDYIYTASFDGDLEKLNYQGRRLNSFSLDRPIYAISKGRADDISSELLFLAMGDEVLRYDSAKNIFTRISTLSAADIGISENGKYLHLEGGGRYAVFTYPAMKLFYSENSGGNFLLFPNGSSIHFFGSTIRFFDFKERKAAGRIVILNDAVGFISPNLDYYGNEQFHQAIEGGLIAGVNPYLLKDKQPNAKLACGGISDFQTSVSKPAAVRPQQTARPQSPQPPVQPTSAAVPLPGVQATEQPAGSTIIAADNSSSVSLPLPPAAGTPQIAASPPPVQPLLESIAPPVLAPGSAIPDWVMRPASLPEFSSVKSGKLPADALKEGRIKIRDDVARAVMKNMLEIEIVKNLPNDEIKKRFLWMVGGRTAQLASEYAVQTDLWVSKENVYYVWGHISTETVNQIYDPIFQEEMNILNTYGNEGYLNRPPLKWE
ncbi:MAG: hypothetical protein LBD73_08460, partial [Deferribacteraceae bacterium]|nr:hypothetical protein [Deferribacteraceae bacterium]